MNTIPRWMVKFLMDKRDEMVAGEAAELHCMADRRWLGELAAEMQAYHDEEAAQGARATQGGRRMSAPWPPG